MSTIKLCVADHFSFDPEYPERFNWSRTLNPKLQAITQDLAAEIDLRREQWKQAGRTGEEPLIPGLQEALRRIAKIAVWVVMSEAKAALAQMAHNQSKNLAGDLQEIV